MCSRLKVAPGSVRSMRFVAFNCRHICLKLVLWRRHFVSATRSRTTTSRKSCKESFICILGFSAIMQTGHTVMGMAHLSKLTHFLVRTCISSLHSTSASRSGPRLPDAPCAEATASKRLVFSQSENMLQKKRGYRVCSFLSCILLSFSFKKKKKKKTKINDKKKGRRRKQAKEEENTFCSERTVNFEPKIWSRWLLNQKVFDHSFPLCLPPFFSIDFDHGEASMSLTSPACAFDECSLRWAAPCMRLLAVKNRLENTTQGLLLEILPTKAWDGPGRVFCDVSRYPPALIFLIWEKNKHTYIAMGPAPHWFFLFGKLQSLKCKHGVWFETLK